MDSLSCKDTHDRIHWAFKLVNRKCTRGINLGQLELLLKILDQVEHPGYLEGPTEDEYENLMYRRRIFTPVEAKVRAEDIWTDVGSKSSVQGFTSVYLEEIEMIPSKVIYAKIDDGHY